MEYKIDYYSMKGEVMETLYFTKSEFYAEVKESNDIGRPIKPTINNIEIELER